MNWSKALKYILRLNEISNRILGHSLQDYRQREWNGLISIINAQLVAILLLEQERL